MRRGEIWWADLGQRRGSAPAKRRPVVIVQSDAFNASAISTVMVAAITSNLRLADAPGNVRLGTRTSKLPKSSVVNVSQVATIDKSALSGRVSALSTETMTQVDEGLRLSLAL